VTKKRHNSTDPVGPLSKKQRASADSRRHSKLESALAPIRASQDADHEASWEALLKIPARKRTAAQKRALKDLAGTDILRQAHYPPPAKKSPPPHPHAKS